MRKPATSKKHNMKSDQRRRSIALLLESDGDCCHWCGVQFTDELPPTLDHLIPRSQYGRNALWNLVLACRPCNEDRADTGLPPSRVAA